MTDKPQGIQLLHNAARSVRLVWAPLGSGVAKAITCVASTDWLIVSPLWLVADMEHDAEASVVSNSWLSKQSDEMLDQYKGVIIFGDCLPKTPTAQRWQQFARVFKDKPVYILAARTENPKCMYPRLTEEVAL